MTPEYLTDEQSIDLGLEGNKDTKKGRLKIGKGACHWIKNAPPGEKRTDEQYGELEGVPQQQANEARNVDVRF